MRLRVARRLEIPIIMHVDVLAGARVAKRDRASGERASVGDRQFVHCCGTSDEELEMDRRGLRPLSP